MTKGASSAPFICFLLLVVNFSNHQRYQPPVPLAVPVALGGIVPVAFYDICQVEIIRAYSERDRYQLL